MRRAKAPAAKDASPAAATLVAPETTVAAAPAGEDPRAAVPITTLASFIGGGKVSVREKATQAPKY
jgi:hypothetical protein